MSGNFEAKYVGSCHLPTLSTISTEELQNFGKRSYKPFKLKHHDVRLAYSLGLPVGRWNHQRQPANDAAQLQPRLLPKLSAEEQHHGRHQRRLHQDQQRDQHHDRQVLRRRLHAGGGLHKQGHQQHRQQEAEQEHEQVHEQSHCRQHVMPQGLTAD